jgi:hypothetical protein
METFAVKFASELLRRGWHTTSKPCYIERGEAAPLSLVDNAVWQLMRIQERSDAQCNTAEEEDPTTHE